MVGLRNGASAEWRGCGMEGFEMEGMWNGVSAELRVCGMEGM